MSEIAPGIEPPKTKNKGGRPKGSLNKLTVSAREAFQAAFDELGGVAGLVKWAKRDEAHMGDFYKLYARLIPTDVKLDLPQLDVGPLNVSEIARELLFIMQLGTRRPPSQPTQH